MTTGFADIHHHLMYGMDEGPSSIDEAKQMILAARLDGIDKIVATPHVVPGLQAFDFELYTKRLELLDRQCARMSGIKLFPGAEIYYTEATRRHLRDQRVPTLAGTEHVLVELAPDTSFKALVAAADDLISGGYIPVLAHIERYGCLVRKPGRAAKLRRQMDVRFQINCLTVVKEKRISVSRFLKKLFGEGLIDAVATDAHDLRIRPVAMSDAYGVLAERYGAEYAAQLTGRQNGLIFT